MVKADKTVQEVCVSAITANKGWDCEAMAFDHYGLLVTGVLTVKLCCLKVLIEAAQVSNLP